MWSVEWVLSCADFATTLTNQPRAISSELSYSECRHGTSWGQPLRHGVPRVWCLLTALELDCLHRVLAWVKTPMKHSRIQLLWDGAVPVREFFRKTTVYVFMGITSAVGCLRGKAGLPQERPPPLSLFSFMCLILCVKLLFGLILVFLGTVNSTFKHLRARQYGKCLTHQYLKEVPHGVMLKII